jgi:hypothetical protein
LHRGIGIDIGSSDIMNEFDQIANCKHNAGRGANLLRDLKFVFAALAAGARTVPLGDNREPVRLLAARAACLYGDRINDQ